MSVPPEAEMSWMYGGNALYIQWKTGAVKTAPVTKTILKEENGATSTASLVRNWK